MSIDEFNSIYNTLYLSNYRRPPSDLNYERNITVRMLDSLGHCEFDYDNRRLYVGIPLLVNLPTYGLSRVVLTGARSPDSIRNLKQTVKAMHKSLRLILKQHQGYPLIPEAIILEVKDLRTIEEAANTLKINYTESVPAWEILNWASGIDGLLKPSDFEGRPELNWKRRVFSTKYMQFISQLKDQNEVQLVEYIDPVTQQRQHWLWRGDRAARVDRDFGRYLALAHDGVNILVYDSLNNRLSVPEFIPLPRLFARALTLCSGVAPMRATIRADNKFGLPPKLPVSVYGGVPMEVSNILSSKLSQRLIAQEIAIDKKGEIL